MLLSSRMHLSRFVKHFVIGIVACSICIGGALYYYRLQLLQRIVAALLVQAGVYDVQFQVRELGYQGAVIEEVNFCTSSQSSQQYCFEGGSARVDLTWTGILTPKVSRLAVEKVACKIKKGTVPSQTLESISLSAIVEELHLVRYVRWAEDISVNGTVSFPEESEFPIVSVTAASHCEGDFCSFDAQAGASDYLLTGSGSENGTSGEFTASVSVNRLEAGMSTLRIGRANENSPVSLAADMQGALLQSFAPFLELSTAKMSAEIEIPSSTSTASTPYPIQGKIEDTGYTSFLLTSGEFTGTVSDDLSAELSATLSFKDMSQPLLVKNLAIAADGGAAGKIEFSAAVSELPAEIRNQKIGKNNVQLVSGNIEASYGFTFAAKEKALTGTLDAKLNDFEGSFAAIQGSGIRTTVAINQTPSELRFKPTLIKGTYLKSGIELDDFEVGFESLVIPLSKSGSPQGYDLRISRATASVFGGTILSGPLRLASSRKESTVTVELQRISIEELIAIYGKDALTATGTLEGKVPIRIDQNKGAFVDKGTLRALQPGGVIKLGESLVSKLTGTPGMDIAARALQDYRYTLLESEINYESDGKLLLHLTLHGNSPALNTTRPVHVNLNVEQNLLKLLKSLRMVEEIESGLKLPKKK